MHATLPSCSSSISVSRNLYKHSRFTQQTDLIAFFSFRFFIDLVEGYPLPFACNYTFGHILQLLASTFLCGPKRQLK